MRVACGDRTGLLSLLAAIALCGLTPSLSAQQEFEGREIRKISIEGLERLPEAQLLAEMKLRIGQPFDSKAASDETGRLYRRGSFSHVYNYEVREFESGVEIIFRVKEKARIRRLLFEATDSTTGKTSLGEKDLREAISHRPGGLLNPYTLDLDAAQIEQTYRDSGYLFADVDHTTRDVDAGVDLAFLIKEGPRVLIQNIEFSGNKTVSDSVLRSRMVTEERGPFFGLFSPGYYDRETLERDIGQIRRYYRGLGFFEARVAVDNLHFHDRFESLDIRIVVEEGPRYVFEGYRFEGNEVFSTPTLESLVRMEPGQFFSGETAEQDRTEILNYYKDRAYIDAGVEWEPDFRLRGTTVQVVFNIEENHEIYIDRVHVRGNVKTQDRVIRRELEFYPGEKFNWSKLEKSRSNLARLQIFSEVEYDLVETDRDRKDVIVKIAEQPTGRLLIGFGVTSGFGVIGNFAMTKRNFDLLDWPESIYDLPDSFTGAGQTLNIVLQPGTRRSLYQFSFTEPYLFESRNSLTLQGSSTTIIRSDFDENRLSFRPSLGHAFDFDRDLVFSVGARLEEVEIDEIDFGSAPDVFAAEGRTSIVALNSTLLYDKVLQEPLEGPYSGHLERVTYEFGGDPLGGEFDFNKLQGSLELYFPLFVHEEGNLHHVISVSSRFGMIEERDDTDSVPIFERFFLGGPNTVRGFRFRGLGPHFNNDALGGTAAWYGNVEYVFPIFQKIVRGVLFFDYGNLSTDLQAFDLDRMRYTVGAGVRVNFPFLGTPLPVGLYLGDAIKKEDEDRTRFFLFTIGAPF